MISRRSVSEHALSALFGAGFTVGLFLTVAHFEKDGPAAGVVETEDLRAVVAPMDPPPPPVVHHEEPIEESTVLGIDATPSESVVKITPSLPDLDSLLPPPAVAPPAVIQVSQLYTNFKPKMAMADINQRIYQSSEVDETPFVLNHVIPDIPRRLMRNITTMTVSVMAVIDVNGEVSSIRLAKSSGIPDFDDIMIQNIPQWTFSPAIKKGVKVKCIILQVIHFKLSGGSPLIL